jgi:hypothetical protein
LESLGVQAVDQLSLEEGIALRDRGMALASLAEPEEWKQRARGCLSYLIGLGTPFTADDLRELIGDPEHVNVVGALFSAAAKAGKIRCLGTRPSTRPERHANSQRIWIGSS